MQARHLFAWHGKQAKRVVVAQRGLGHEGELGQVSQRLQVTGMHAFGIKGGFVKRHVVVGVLQRPFQALQLQG